MSNTIIEPTIAPTAKPKRTVDPAKRKRRSNMTQVRRASDALSKLDLRAMPREHLFTARQLRTMAEALDRQLAAYEQTR